MAAIYGMDVLLLGLANGRTHIPFSISRIQLDSLLVRGCFTCGVLTMLISGFLAPSLAGAFAATIYLLTKYLVLLRKDSTRAGLIASPFFFFTTTTILTMSIGESNIQLLKSGC
jgi:hypothetical protein